MEDLLEYISIYSQMNNIKFESLNHDKYIQIKSPKKSKKSSKDSSKTHKKWKSISKFDFTKANLTPRDATQEAPEFHIQSMKSNELKETKTQAEIQSHLSLLDSLADSVIILEEEKGSSKNLARSEPKYVFKVNYSTLYRVMFESTNQRKVDGKNETRNGLLRDICKAMHYTVTHKTEDVIQAVEVLEYFVSILADFGSKELIKYALKLILEVLKGDFVIKGERPFKSFY